MRLQIERYMQRTISVHLIVEDVLHHAAINILLGMMDGPELIQATPHGHVLPKIQIERILLGNFDRSSLQARSVRSCAH